MGDYERRHQNFRGGGGGGGGGNFRKRRYREDDDYDRRPQRRRFEEPAHVKLRKRLVVLAESTSQKSEDEISELSKLVNSNADDEELQKTFISTLMQLVVEQPLKIPFLASLILAINTPGAATVVDLLKRAGELLETHISEGSWREAKLILRLLACLQPVWEEDGIFRLLEQLFSRAVDLQTASSEDGLGLELVKIILLTMAYAMAAQPNGFESSATALLEKTDIVASTPHVLENLAAPAAAAENAPTKSVIGMLQLQMQSESENGWPLKCIARPWQSQVASGLAGTKHAFPAVAIPSVVSSTAHPLLPEVYFSVYEDSEIETVPSTENIASLIMRDSIVDTINILSFNRNAAAKCLIDIDCYVTPGTFIARATPFDKLREHAGDGSTWKPEDVAVDAVFSQLLQLPMAEHKLVYYHSLLTELCKLGPAAIAPSLGRAIRSLYRRLDEMDLELDYRFLDWFTHHLSNFGFTWKWTEWVDDIDLPLTHIRKAFIVGALEKEIRLSVAQRIKGTIPEAYQPLIGEEKGKDTPDFKYSDPTHPYSTQARELVRLIKTKAPDAEVEEQLHKIQEAAIEVEGTNPVIPSTDAYVTALCFVGSTSLSHILSCIERSKDRLQTLGGTSDAARYQIITSVLAYWRDRPGNGINIIDKLLNYTILQPTTIIEWVFVENLRSGAVLAEPHIYEMVSRTLFKVAHRLRQLVAARLQPGLAAEQAALCDQSIATEAAQLQQLFAIVEDATRGVAEGSAEGLAEGGAEHSAEGMVDSDAARSPEEIATLRRWGAKWRRVFARKFAVEEAWRRETLAAGPLPVEAADGVAKNGAAETPPEAMEAEATG